MPRCDNPERIFNSVLYSILITHAVSGSQSRTEGIFIPLIVGFPEDSIEYFTSSVLLDASEKHPSFQNFFFFNVCGREEEGKKKDKKKTKKQDREDF